MTNDKIEKLEISLKLNNIKNDLKKFNQHLIKHQSIIKKILNDVKKNDEIANKKIDKLQQDNSFIYKKIELLNEHNENILKERLKIIESKIFNIEKEQQTNYTKNYNKSILILTTIAVLLSLISVTPQIKTFFTNKTTKEQK